jgi:dihydrofolate synthase / folylpolyglutamate synthase
MAPSHDVSYPDSVRYLYSLGNELKSGAKWNLERMRALMAALGNPERGQRFVHVAGTNGKGSTCAMIASVLRRHGLRTGLYTSPHLIQPTERIEVDGEPVTEAEFAQAFEIVHAAAEKLDEHASYFEIVTAMALTIFRERCEIGVMEVGLGGRLDATNVITPELCLITPIAYDHEAYLGNTLESIASEKAGIIKPGIPVVMARQLAGAEGVITARAREMGARVLRAEDAGVRDIEVFPRGSRFMIGSDEFECGLAGRHQVENATAVILACRVLGIGIEAIQGGLRYVKWPGRLEFVSQKPDLVLDGAHNPAAAEALAAYIREFWSDRPVWMVYGAMRDKAVEEVTAQLFPLAERLIVTAANFPRSLRPEAILELTPHPHARVTANVAAAIEMARSAPAAATVFITGSLFVVGEARALLLGVK